jgi:hypothetical protein
MSNFSFKCSNCDKTHEGVPSFNLEVPIYYYSIPEEQRDERMKLTSETCILDNEHFFAKGIIEIPIKDKKEGITFCVWVSLSESNFKLFQESLNSKEASNYPQMFGWFSSNVDTFGDCINLKTNMVFRDNHLRPLIDIEPTNHPLSVACNNGFSQENAQKLIEYYLHK